MDIKNLFSYLASTIRAVTTLIINFEKINNFIKSSAKEIRDNKDKYLEDFNKKNFKELYIERLEKFLNNFSNKYGKPFSIHPLSFNTNLAVIYSFAVFLVLYFYTGNGKLGNLQILIGDLSKGIKGFCIVLIILYSYVLFKIHKKIYNNLFQNFKLNIENIIYIFIVLSPNILVAMLIALEWNKIYSVSLTCKTIIIIAFAVNLSMAIVYVLSNINSIKKGYGAYVFNITYLSVVGLSAVFSSFLQPYNNYTKILTLLGFILICIISGKFMKLGKKIYLLNVGIFFLTMFLIYYTKIFGMDVMSATLIYFFVILPFINGIFDYLSLGISRLLAEHIVKTKSSKNIIIDIVIDLFIAFIFLLLLITVFIFLTYMYNYFFINVTNQSFQIPVKKIINTAVNHPTSQTGLWFFSMMFSTLLPTFIHLFIVISVFFFSFFKIIQNQTITLLEKNELNRIEEFILVFNVKIYNNIMALLISILIYILIIIYTAPLLKSWIQEMSPAILSIVIHIWK